MNNNILPSDEFIEYEGQFYSNPQKGLEESNTFIDNLRNVQNANNAEINTQTSNLGTVVPSNLGGLVGGEGYWTSRYQTPQTNAVAANLKSAAQYNALMESLQDQTNAWKQRYSNAYKAARRRAASYGGGGGGNNPSNDPTKPDVEENIITPKNFYGPPDTIVSETDTHYIYTDPKTGKQEKVSKDYMKQIYDDNGSITDDGMVILDTRRMLGL